MREARITFHLRMSKVQIFLQRDFSIFHFVKLPMSGTHMVKEMPIVALFQSEVTRMGQHLTKLEMLRSLFSVRGTWGFSK